MNAWSISGSAGIAAAIMTGINLGILPGNTKRMLNGVIKVFRIILHLMDFGKVFRRITGEEKRYDKVITL